MDIFIFSFMLDSNCLQKEFTGNFISFISAVYCSLSHSRTRALLSFVLMQTKHLLLLVFHITSIQLANSEVDFCEAVTGNSKYLAQSLVPTNDTGLALALNLALLPLFLG